MHYGCSCRYYPTGDVAVDRWCLVHGDDGFLEYDNGLATVEAERGALAALVQQVKDAAFHFLYCRACADDSEVCAEGQQHRAALDAAGKE